MLHMSCPPAQMYCSTSVIHHAHISASFLCVVICSPYLEMSGAYTNIWCFCHAASSVPTQMLHTWTFITQKSIHTFSYSIVYCAYTHTRRFCQAASRVIAWMFYTWTFVTLISRRTLHIWMFSAHTHIWRFCHADFYAYFPTFECSGLIHAFDASAMLTSVHTIPYLIMYCAHIHILCFCLACCVMSDRRIALCKLISSHTYPYVTVSSAHTHMLFFCHAALWVTAKMLMPAAFKPSCRSMTDAKCLSTAIILLHHIILWYIISLYDCRTHHSPHTLTSLLQVHLLQSGWCENIVSPRTKWLDIYA